MDALIEDLIKETTVTTGSGLTLTLTEEANYGRFSEAASVGQSVYYAIRSGTDSEMGIGTVQTGNTFDRTTPLVTLVSGVYDKTTPARISLLGISTIAIAPSAAALNDIISDAIALNSAHTGAVAGAHAASAISYAGSTNLVATEVEAALDELDTEKAGLALANVFTQDQEISGATPTTIFNETDAGVDLKQWNVFVGAEAYNINSYTDANANILNLFKLDRIGNLTLAGELVGNVVGTDIQAYDADTTKNDVANTFTLANTFDEIISADKGIGFPATQVPSADPNTNDDYEEGDWTPTITMTTSQGTASISVISANYTKSGDVITVFLDSELAKGTGTGALRISGFPVSFTQITAFSASSVGIGATGKIPVYATNVSNYVTVYLTDQGTGFGADAVDTDMGATSFLKLTLTHKV